MNRICLPVLLSCAMLLLGCPPERPEIGSREQVRTGVGDLTVARVNGEEISAAEYEERIASMPDYARAEFSTVARRKQQLAPLVDFELLADEAERRGLGNDPRVVDAVKEHLANQAVDGRERDEILSELRAATPPKMDVGAVETALSEKR